MDDTLAAADLPLVVHLAMGAAFAAYALVGVACFGMLGDEARRYPNVLTAFGDVPLVAAGSAAVALGRALAAQHLPERHQGKRAKGPRRAVTASGTSQNLVTGTDGVGQLTRAVPHGRAITTTIAMSQRHLTY